MLFRPYKNTTMLQNYYATEFVINTQRVAPSKLKKTTDFHKQVAQSF
jgi:hypothetical protein